MRTLSTVLVVWALTFTPAILSAQPQSGGTPQTYSITLTMGAGMTVKVARDGPKESVEQAVPKSQNGPGMHIRQIYDFAAQRVWTMDLEGGPCSVAIYTSPYVPAPFDPMSGVEEMRAGLAQYKPAVLRSETVNGIATKVYEMPVPDIKGKMRIFLEEKHNLAVKMVMVPAGEKEQTMMEITSLSFAKPAADLFVAPQDCQAQGGETNATGGHAEVKIDASAQGEKKLGAAKPAQKPAAAPASRAAAPAAGAPLIEIRGAGVSPLNYDGPAPAVYQFAFSIDASGPVEAQWVLVSQANTAWASGKLVFEAAGTKELSVPVKIGVSNGKHWEGSGHLEVVVGGKRISSVALAISADCKAK